MEMSKSPLIINQMSASNGATSLVNGLSTSFSRKANPSDDCMYGTLKEKKFERYADAPYPPVVRFALPLFTLRIWRQEQIRHVKSVFKAFACKGYSPVQYFPSLYHSQIYGRGQPVNSSNSVIAYKRFQSLMLSKHALKC